MNGFGAYRHGTELCLYLCARVVTPLQAKGTNEKGKTHHGWKSKAEISTPTDRAEVELKLMHRGSQQAAVSHTDNNRPPNQTNEPTYERTNKPTTERTNEPSNIRKTDSATEKIMCLKPGLQAVIQGENKGTAYTVRCLHGGRLKAGLNWKHHKRTEHKYKGKDQVVRCVYYFKRRHRHNTHAHMHTDIHIRMRCMYTSICTSITLAAIEGEISIGNCAYFRGVLLIICNYNYKTIFFITN